MIAGLVVIALFIFLGVQLYRMILGLLGVVASGGEDMAVDNAYEEIWTQPPYYADESDFDNVSAVREYAEPSPAAQTAP